MLEKLRGIVVERNLGDIIEITGRLSSEKMPEVYQQSDMFISATMQEGMSNAMLEAMASGLPIITTRCEGVQELIEDNGIVVENSDAEAIAEAIVKLADDRQLYKQMRKAARKQAEAFRWKSVAEQYLDYYDKIIRKTTGF